LLIVLLAQIARAKRSLRGAFDILNGGPKTATEGCD
jgi:hypothetical protein